MIRSIKILPNKIDTEMHLPHACSHKALVKNREIFGARLKLAFSTSTHCAIIDHIFSDM